MTDDPSRRRAKTPGDQLTVWAPEAEPTVNTIARPKQAARQPALINPVMAEWARKSANISVERVAKRLRIGADVIAEWETGAARPSIPQLRKLARLYKRPLAAFFLPAPPRHFTVAKDFRRLPDHAPIPFSTDLLFAQRIATYRRDVALELEPDTEPAAFVGSATLDTPSATLAGRARDLLRVSLTDQEAWSGEYDALNGWKNAVEELGVLVFHFSSVKVTEVRGFSISEPVLPVIALNGGDSVNGRVFTLIHEFGHLLLGEGGNCDLADYSRPSAPSLPIEVYANAFAGALLVPRDALLRDQAVAQAKADTEWADAELERLARKFRVSREVILRRLLALGRASEDFYRAWRADLLALPAPTEGKSKGRPGVAVMTVRDVGKPFARLVLDAYRTNGLTGGDVSELLGVRLRHLPAIEARLGGADILTGGER